MTDIRGLSSLLTATTEELFKYTSGLLKEQEYAHEVIVNGTKYRLCHDASMWMLEMAFSVLRYKVEGNPNGWSISNGKS